MRESALEALFRIRLKEAGGWSMKLEGVAGVPDRLVLLHGRLMMVELKTGAGRLSKVQKARIAHLRALGAEIHVLRGKTELMTFFETPSSNSLTTE